MSLLARVADMPVMWLEVDWQYTHVSGCSAGEWLSSGQYCTREAV